MIGSPSTPLARQARLLARLIRTLRKERRMTVAEVAKIMGIAPRTYQDFEAGKGELDLNKIRLFATAGRNDAVANVLALMFNDPELAVLSMDNKLPSTFWVAFKEFRDRVGDRLSIVPPALILSAFRRAFDEIEAYLAKRTESTEEWLERAIADAYRPDDAAPPDPDEDKT
jgi:transcriptional regulator with XRE-family HTH domain